MIKTHGIESFKGLSSLELQVPCNGIHISHKYCIGVLVLSNQVHLINTDDLLQGNESRAVGTGIIAQHIVGTEDNLAAAFQALVSIYSFADLKQSLATINASTQIRTMAFNPTDSTMLAVLTERGNLILAHFTSQGLQTHSFNDSNITAMCFSPKGKQLCVGHSDGSMSQLKLDLTLAKRIPSTTGIPLSILWVSTTQFLVSFLVNRDQLELVQIDLQKAQAPPLYHLLSDPFVSDAASPSSQTFMTLLHPKVIICSASTSADVVVLSNTSGKWQVELGDDDRKADLPLDHYSVGQAIYFNATAPVMVDGREYGAMPLYVLASQHGVVRTFSIINAEGKGEGGKYSEGLTPLNLSIFSSQVQLPATVPVVVESAPVPPLVSTVPSFSFEFNQSLPQPQPVTVGTESRPIFSTPSKPKEELKQIQETKKNLKQELDKEEKVVKTDELSANAVIQFEELQKRFTKFQTVRTSTLNQASRDLGTVKENFERSVKDLARAEDFIHDLEKTCGIQQREIGILKEKVISDLAQIEYVKGIEETNRDPDYLQLLRSRPLDWTVTVTRPFGGTTPISQTPTFGLAAPATTTPLIPVSIPKFGVVTTTPATSPFTFGPSLVVLQYQ